MTDETRTAALPPVLQGRYRLGPVIGKGGASVVYRGRDQLLGRDVAVKVFTARAADPQELRAQEAEARMLGALSHPGLVTLFDAGIDFTDIDAPQVFLVMELVRDFDLRERLRRGPLDAHQVAYIGFDLAGALEYVHDHGIVHRDMKPANVLLFDGGVERPMRAKLADFGIAMLRAQGVLPTEFTTGTAAYLSPEQVEGAELGAETDVYSLGLVLIEAISGRVVYPGSVVDSALARLDRQPEVPAGVPGPLATVLTSMVERRPADRPTTAEVAVALREVLVDQIGGRRPAPAPHDAETARLEAVQRYNLVDTPPDGAFDRITSLAARIFDVPVALVSIVDADRIWFKSHYGVDVSETERRRGLATSGGLHDHTLVIEDIATDPRTGAYPESAANRGLRFYAGVPLMTPDGHNLGSLALIDYKPRTMTDQEVAILEDLAAMVLHEMELRLAARRVVLRRD
jgi:eukaryotic-like serine/threonine-protein kinase